MAYITLCRPQNSFYSGVFHFKAGKNYRDPMEIERNAMTRPPMTKVNHGKVDVSKVAPRIHEAMTVIAEKGTSIYHVDT